jgi:hypothetical protein
MRGHGKPSSARRLGFEVQSPGYGERVPVLPGKGGERTMLLILGIILLVIAIAGGVIIHPIIFALAIVALVLFFMR